MILEHQLDEDTFRAILPEEITWEPFPAFPAGARLAVMVGHPAEPGPYLIWVKVPRGTKLMPHKHPEDRIYTVISGVFYIGLGEAFDDDKLKAYPPGSVIVLPGETWHFHWAKSGEYVTQVSALSPLGLEYHDSRDDSRGSAGAAIGSERSNGRLCDHSNSASGEFAYHIDQQFRHTAVIDPRRLFVSRERIE
ncbi:cupin domain-containing protein [Bradyrhizobium sp. SUTN9-2]|uniref:cupin domain-containing protein n=1 Tax=Bradyrhizobium sp. SUTN9-2 TaxID=1167456 RepID=UPI001FCEDF6F|nr:cupin domain-containing protein [Bradyrhizobium sp. SUTN9-2]